MKTIQLDDEVHKRVKLYCGKYGLKINKWIESILITILNQDDELEKELPSIFNKLIKESK